MKPPIIVDEHGDIEAYASLEEAALAMEPIDVSNGEYCIYDSTGDVLCAEFVSDTDPPRIACAIPHRNDAAGLREKVIDWILRVGPDRLGLAGSSLDRLSLEDLARAVHGFQRGDA